MTHTLLAQGIVRWDWDGVIPDRQTKGSSVTKGSLVDICKVVDAEWFHVHHQGSCEYIPRALLDVTRVYEERFRSQFPTLAGQDLKIVDPKILPAPSLPESRRGLLARLYGSRVGSARLYRRRLSSTNLPKPNIEVQRPIIPPAPFPKEHVAVDNNTSPVKVVVDCKEINPLQSAVTFRLFIDDVYDSIISGFLRRVTFDVMSLDGTRVAALFPENYDSALTDGRQQLREWEGVLRRTASGLIPHQAGPENRRGRTTAESMRYTIRGGGVDTNHANWVVAEDTRSESGLPKSFLFRLLLPTDRVPPTIKYMVNLEWEAVTESDKTSERSPITETWKSECVEVELSTRSPGAEVN